MGKLRIAIASSGLGHVFRGIEGWAQDLAAALYDRGEDVVLFKGGGAAELPYERVLKCLKREDDATKRLHRMLPKRLVWRVGLGSVYGIEQITFGIKLLRHLRAGAFDLLHVQDPQLAQFVQRAKSLGLVRTKVILAHGTNEPVEFLSRIEFLQHLAPWHLEETKKAGAWKPTWSAIPNFIDTASFSPSRNDAMRSELGISRDAIVILCVAAIKREHKRIDYLLAEFARLIESCPQLPVHLVVAGGAEAETDELVELGRKTLGDRFTPLVRFPRHRMAELYRAADVFTLCSLREMMPIALVEATASGLPCVVHNHPILRWIAGSGEQAVIDMSAGGALADALRELCFDSDRRAALGQLARRHCEANFGRDSVVSQIVAYYDQVAGNEIKTSDVRLQTHRPNALELASAASENV